MYNKNQLQLLNINNNNNGSYLFRCPCPNDRYLSAVIPVGASSGLDWPSHYKRVMFQMFTFVEPNALTPLKEQVNK